MTKKEVVLEIIGLYDEIARLQEENKILKLQQGLANISGEKIVLKEKKKESDPESSGEIITKMMKEEFFNRNFGYNLESYSVTGGPDEDKYILPFDIWYKNMGIRDMIGYNEHILTMVSLSELKKFFIPELKDFYQKQVDEVTKKGGEDDEIIMRSGLRCLQREGQLQRVHRNRRASLWRQLRAGGLLCGQRLRKLRQSL